MSGTRTVTFASSLDMFVLFCGSPGLSFVDMVVTMPPVFFFVMGQTIASFYTNVSFLAPFVTCALFFSPGSVISLVGRGARTVSIHRPLLVPLRTLAFTMVPTVLVLVVASSTFVIWAGSFLFVPAA